VNEQIERHLDAESTSESRGYVGDGRVGRGTGVPSGNGVLKNGPAGWSTPRADVEVRPLASVADLLDVARSEEVSPS
jgi:hypothetical protein